MPMPEGSEEGICRGIYKLRSAEKGEAIAQVFGSGAILNEALRAQETLFGRYEIGVNVWSVTSYNEVYKDAVEIERWNLLHEDDRKIPYIVELLEGEEGPVIAASDYVKSLPNQLGPWIKNGITALGTDGWGRSDMRDKLRDYFEVSAEFIVFTVLSQLVRTGKVENELLGRAADELGINFDKPNPATPSPIAPIIE